MFPDFYVRRICLKNCENTHRNDFGSLMKMMDKVASQLNYKELQRSIMSLIISSIGGCEASYLMNVSKRNAIQQPRFNLSRESHDFKAPHLL